MVKCYNFHLTVPIFTSAVCQLNIIYELWILYSSLNGHTSQRYIAFWSFVVTVIEETGFLCNACLVSILDGGSCSPLLREVKTEFS